MKRICQYILSFLILVLSVGQKDIALLIQEITEKEYIVKYDLESDEDSEEDSEEEKVEEEIEGKRKKDNNYVPFSPFLSLINCSSCNKYKFSFKESLYTNQNAYHNNIPQYLKNCSLVYYES